jgi:hypothetical protein
MLLRDEVRLVGYGALAIAAVLVILALLVRPLAGTEPTVSAIASPIAIVAVKTQDRMAYLPQRVLTERFYRDVVAQDAADALVASWEASPAWLTAETAYPLPPLPPERPRERTGAAPTAAPRTPQMEPQKLTSRPERAACLRHGLKTVWSGQYRWRCRR